MNVHLDKGQSTILNCGHGFIRMMHNHEDPGLSSGTKHRLNREPMTTYRLYLKGPSINTHPPSRREPPVVRPVVRERGSLKVAPRVVQMFQTGSDQVPSVDLRIPYRLKRRNLMLQALNTKTLSGFLQSVLPVPMHKVMKTTRMNLLNPNSIYQLHRQS